MKKKQILFLIIYLSFFSSIILATQNTKKLNLHFFGSSTCGECAEIKEVLLKPMLAQNSTKLNITFYDLDTDTGTRNADAMERKFNIEFGSPQELFFPDTFLLGFDDIMSIAPTLISEYLSDTTKWSEGEKVDIKSTKETIKRRLEKFTFWGITLAAIIDGINPCAIATMIFLISFFTTKKRTPSEILKIGLVFTLSVFITYLLLGVGAFKALSALSMYHKISEIIRWSAIIFAGSIAMISFYDAIRYKISGNTDEVKLQLPKSIKTRIHKVISGNLSGPSVIIGALITGFLVTLLEAVCTGQVYLPTIIIMTKATGFKFIGWAYLIYYNLLFVLPLLVIMVMAFYGLKWGNLADITRKNMTLVKILIGLIMLALALFLAFAD